MSEYDVVLLPSFAQVENWRKARAQAGASGLFSQVVTTFDAWIADLWELHGDGRSLVGPLKRRVLMRFSFERLADGEGRIEAISPDGQRDYLTVSDGVVEAAARCVRRASGVRAFEEALLEEASHEEAERVVTVELTLRERAFVQGIRKYRETIEEAGLVEFGEVCARLAAMQERVFPHALSVLVCEAEPFDWCSSQFYEDCSQLEVSAWPAASSVGLANVREGCEAGFAFPAGRYAQAALVADELRHQIDAGEAHAGEVVSVIACKDPLVLYKQLESAFARMGVQGCVQARVPFGQTDFGRQFLSMRRVEDDELWSTDDLSDAVSAPFSGFDRRQALDIDRALRADRLVDRDEALMMLCAASDTFSQLEEVAGDPQADILLGVFEQIAFTSPHRSESWRVEQLAAVAALRECTSAARLVGADIRACAHVLENVQVIVTYEGIADGGGENGRVVVTTPSAAARMGEGSCRLLVLCDQTSDDYPVADKDNAVSTLLSKWGLSDCDTALGRARREFSALQKLPSERLVFMRPLNDWDGNPTYPSATLQEFIDSCCITGNAADELDGPFGLPERFSKSCLQRGEELLYSNAVARNPYEVQELRDACGGGAFSEVSPPHRFSVPLARRVASGCASPGFSPSPSQVEAYLECPYKWFVQSRLNVEELDEGFGALERGSFAHAVLQEFYQRFQETGDSKVNASNKERARQLMRQVADEVALAQYGMEPSSGRYVATSQIELREIAACKDQLVSFLDFEEQFLPTFHPAYFEYTIDAEASLRYAGHVFIGTVDRIDVDASGNAVIVDYKGSLSSAYEIAGASDASPGKVQTRMYAQAIGRLLGLNVVAALYVSYGKKHACCGAYDGRFIEAAHLPYTRHDHCRSAIASPPDQQAVEDYAQLSFADMLDRTEMIVAAAMERMALGDVAPQPSEPDTCRYCLASSCPRRNE